MNKKASRNSKSIAKPKEGEEPRMFVGGLFPETTSDTVRIYFETFGAVKEVKIIGEKQKRSRGFGFVLFGSFDTLNKVMASKHIVDGREVDCNFAVYSNKTDKDEAAQKNEKKIFLSELPSSVVKQDLIDTFDQFGDIEKVMIVKRKNKDHSFGFVIFNDKA
jgi:RNA recognition motif-containing protein